MPSVSKATLARVLARLGIDPDGLARTPSGLDRVYRAWCRAVPFDNTRKLIALAEGDDRPLPGGGSEDFFEAWLRDGTGGTCWPSSNALCALIGGLGFEARRISASMQDMGKPNHGSVVVRFGSDDYLADSSMLTDAVFPVRRGERVQRGGPLHPVSVEPDQGTLLISWTVPFSDDQMPCRLLDDPVDHDFYLERYEISRASGRSPFNDLLYARRNLEQGVLSYQGRTRFWKRPEGVVRRELSPAELADSLRSELGLSRAMVERLRAAGKLG